MREVVLKLKCDRCHGVIEESGPKESVEGEDKEPMVCLSGAVLDRVPGLDPDALIQFDDLCTKCEDRIVSLIEAIMKSGKGRGKAKAKVVTKKNNATPPTEETAPAPAA